MVTTTRQERELETRVEEEVIGILEEAEATKPFMGYWYVQFPSPGVRIYSFDPPKSGHTRGSRVHSRRSMK